MATTRKTNVKAATNSSINSIKLTIERKREKEAKAQYIVESMVEAHVTENELLEIIKDIRQSHYVDITEERSIVKLCGYPICPNTLKSSLGKRFKISTKSNRVFDITERKRFCSNQCYKSSKYLEEQLLTCPIWIDEKLVEVKLLPLDNGGLAGIDVKFRPTKKDIEMLEVDSEPDTENTKLNGVDVPQLPSSEIEMQTASTSLPANANNSALLISPRNDNPITDGKSKQLKGTVLDTDALFAKIETVLKEWMTLESVQYLIGGEKVKERIESTSCHDERDYRDLCTNLDEANDKLEDLKLVEKASDVGFEMSQKETRANLSRVQAFYKGEVGTAPDDADDTNGSESCLADVVGEERIWTPVLPLIDVKNQKQMRMKIVYDQLSKALLDTLTILQMSARDITSQVKRLISTFNLTAKNITLLPLEWMLVTMIILQLLSRQDSTLRGAIGSVEGQKCLNAFLNEVGKDTQYVESVSNRLLDITYTMNVN